MKCKFCNKRQEPSNQGANMLKYLTLTIPIFLLYGCETYSGHDEDGQARRGKHVSVNFTEDIGNHCRGFITPYEGGDIVPKVVIIEGCSVDNQRPR